MKPTSTPKLAKLIQSALMVATALSLTGCATAFNYDEEVVKGVETQRLGPRAAPRINQTSFAPALRCMDLMFETYGVKGIDVLVEDLPDSTKKVKAGAKDMFISAVSEMTRRSRGVNLVAFSIRDQTLGALIGLGTRNRILENTPAFAIRGSVSQFDEDMVRKQGDAGIGIGAVSAGVAAQGAGSVLALDLAMLNTRRLTLVPGVVSKNSVLVFRQGSGADGEVNTRKFGLNFNFVLSKTEGTAQALRTLSELAAIELLGKLVKVPYWRCLDADDSTPIVLNEIADWWETLASDPASLVGYFQQQMLARGVYTGGVDGQVTEELLSAVGIYQKAMGLEPDSTLDFDFFRAYLATDHRAIEKEAVAILDAGGLQTLAQIAEENYLKLVLAATPAESVAVPTEVVATQAEPVVTKPEQVTVEAAPKTDEISVSAKAAAVPDTEAVITPTIESEVTVEPEATASASFPAPASGAVSATAVATAMTAPISFPAAQLPDAGDRKQEVNVPHVYVAGQQGRNTIHTPGAAFSVDVAVDTSANLYCYLLDENQRVTQFFPNPLQQDSSIQAGTRMQFPGKFPFELIASRTGQAETITCIASSKSAGAVPLKDLPLAGSVQQIHRSFADVVGPDAVFGIGTYDVSFK